MFLALAMIAIGAVMSWETLRYFTRARSHGEPLAQAAAAAKPPSADAVHFAPWQQDVLADFAQAAQQAKSRKITNAEVQVDQAVSEMEEARVRSRSAPESFFSRASTALDAIATAQPSKTQDTAQSMAAGRLFQHVTQARIELAAMRSSQEPMPAGSTLAAEAVARAAGTLAEADAANEAAAQANVPSDAPEKPSPSAAAAPRMPKLPAGHVALNAPRELAENALLDPAALGGNFLDASLMPDDVEILLPPETRQFADNVRVENLTIAGASQTLDGIHWRNVTFIGTRLRYEDGQLDLRNVRFLHCTFGFPSDARGASVANAIALGKTSFTIQ